MVELGLVTVVVADYDEAIRWYTAALGLTLREDVDMGGGKRWVVVGPAGGGTGLLLARGATPDQRSRIGDHTGGRVGFFLHSTDFAADHRMRAAGVRFAEPPRHESYGTVAVFTDPYGNRWDRIEPA